VPLRDVLREIRAGAGRRPLLVPVPSRLLLVPVWLAAKAGIRLPNQRRQPPGPARERRSADRSDLPAFVPQPLTLAEMVRAAARGGASP
jgi:hypothetical protein